MQAIIQPLQGEFSRAAIAAAAGLHPNYLADVLAGRRVCNAATLAKLQLAVKRLKARQDDGGRAVTVAYRAVLALVAQRLGVDPAMAQAQSPARRAVQNSAWAKAADARRLAQYLMNATLGFHQAEVARASGVTRQAVSLACREVEEWRDEAGMDGIVDGLEAALMGAGDGV